MERWLKLLNMLSEDSYITNKRLSEQLNVSKRTIYNDIAGLNDTLRSHGAQIITKPHYGITLVISDRTRFQSFLNTQKQDSVVLVDSSDARARMIIQKMISAGKAVKFDDLCEELFISRSTLKNDLKKVRSVLEMYDLKIESSAYKGSWIDGLENNVRKCLTDIGKQMLNDSSKTLNGDIKAIAGIIKQVFQKHHLRMTELAFNNLVIHIYIAIMRIRMGYTLEAAEGYEQFTSDREREIATEIIAGMENLFGLKFPKTELGYIMLHLEGKKISDVQDNSVVTADIYEMVTEMLDEIDSMFHYNFKYDFELVSLLSTHLVSLKVRILYDMTLENPLIEEIQEGALLAYEMARVACSKLEKHYGKKVTQDEMAYIALHFQLAIERYKEKHKKNVLIVCGTGRGSAELLAYHVKKDYGNYLNVVGTLESTNLDGIDFDDYDYILTTVHIEEKVPIPIIEINSIQNAESRTKLNNYLYFDKKSELLRFFSRSRFLPHMKGTSKQEVLRQLCERAMTDGCVSEGFYDLVLKREEIGTTSFGNLIAIPHPYRPEGDQSFVVTGILDEPIQWDQEEVQIVFLLSMKANGDHNLQLFYKSVGKLLSSKESVAALIQKQDFETLISVLDSLRDE
ncbi:MAG: transcription antiterminator [Butyrivibrio sp.]|nr:transcription antiterminator [Butyrivibrio sp.]